MARAKGIITGHEHESSRRSAVYKKIYIEITNRCNLRCSFCPSTQRPGQFMSVDAFTDILRKIKGYTQFISLHVLGEPLLHPDLPQLLEKAASAGLRVNLTTNGTLLAKRNNELLAARALRQINISLHSLAQLDPVTRELHYENIFDFAQTASAASSLSISLRLWNYSGKYHQDNDHLLARLLAFFHLPAHIFSEIKAGQGIALAPRVFLNPECQFDWPTLETPVLGRQGYCRGMRDHIAILVNGTVVPCCLDAEGILALGNIFHHSLEEIVAAPRACRIIKGFVDQHVVEPLCQRCSFRLRFGSAGM